MFNYAKMFNYTKGYYLLQKYKFSTAILDFLSYLKRIFTVKKINEDLLNNIEGYFDYNIPISRFYEKKKSGISGVARLKNADCFLEKCMESRLPFLDELILVDNLSNDKTREICGILKKRYPNKVKIYQYPFGVIPPSNDNMKIPGNSVNSLAYYYNWCFSKTKYSHVVKVDDDMFIMNEKYKNIREGSLKGYDNRYNIYRGINVIKNDKGDFGTLKGSEYSGKYGDNGIYKVGPYAYYIQGSNREVLHHNYRVRRHGLTFLHLKLLKPSYGLHNLQEDDYKHNRTQQYLESSFNYGFDELLKGEKNIKLKKYIDKIDTILKSGKK